MEKIRPEAPQSNVSPISRLARLGLDIVEEATHAQVPQDEISEQIYARMQLALSDKDEKELRAVENWETFVTSTLTEYILSDAIELYKSRHIPGMWRGEVEAEEKIQWYEARDFESNFVLPSLRNLENYVIGPLVAHVVGRSTALSEGYVSRIGTQVGTDINTKIFLSRMEASGPDPDKPLDALRLFIMQQYGMGRVDKIERDEVIQSMLDEVHQENEAMEYAWRLAEEILEEIPDVDSETLRELLEEAGLSDRHIIHEAIMHGTGIQFKNSLRRLKKTDPEALRRFATLYRESNRQLPDVFLQIISERN